MTVRYRSASIDDFIENHSHDVSRGGMFIKTKSPFPPGTLLKFEVRIAEEQRVLQGVGRVVWKRDSLVGNEQNPAGMGVKFIKIDKDTNQIIDRLLGSRAEGEAAYEFGARSAGVKVSSPPPAIGSIPPSRGASESRAKSTQIGLGSVYSNPPVGFSTPPAGFSNPPFPANEAFFPFPGSPSEQPALQDRTVMRQTKELLEQALEQVGSSLADVGADTKDDKIEAEDSEANARSTKPGAPAPTPAKTTEAAIDELGSDTSSPVLSKVVGKNTAANKASANKAANKASAPSKAALPSEAAAPSKDAASSKDAVTTEGVLNAASAALAASGEAAARSSEESSVQGADGESPTRRPPGLGQIREKTAVENKVIVDNEDLDVPPRTRFAVTTPPTMRRDADNKPGASSVTPVPSLEPGTRGESRDAATAKSKSKVAPWLVAAALLVGTGGYLIARSSQPSGTTESAKAEQVVTVQPKPSSPVLPAMTSRVSESAATAAPTAGLPDPGAEAPRAGAPALSAPSTAAPEPQEPAASVTAPQVTATKAATSPAAPQKPARPAPKAAAATAAPAPEPSPAAAPAPIPLPVPKVEAAPPKPAAPEPKPAAPAPKPANDDNPY